MKNNYNSISEICGCGTSVYETNNNMLIRDSNSVTFNKPYSGFCSATSLQTMRRYYGSTLDVQNHLTSMIEQDDTSCYSENKKRSSEMSFVGIYAIDNGVLAFGDSKSSRESVLGGFIQDGPPSRIKVFKHDKFVMVTYGLNRIFDSKRNRNVVPIETVIPSLMDEVTGYREFLLAFQDYLWFVQSVDTYRFAFGIKEKGIYKVVAYNVSQKIIELTTNSNDGLFCYGVPFYTSKMQDIREQFRERTVEEAAEKISDIIKGLVKEADEKFDTYNPVGGEIRIEILK